MRFFRVFGVSLIVKIILFAYWICAYGQSASPIGSWVTLDDLSQKPRSIVSIKETNGKLNGIITKIYYRPGENTDMRCNACSGAKHNQKILGSEIFWDLTPDEVNTWRGGRILDIETGDTYKCTLTLLPDGNTLKVRSYLGLSLLGRTHTWIREK